FHDRVEPHVPAHVALVGDMVGILLELRAGGEQSRPVRVGLEPVGIGGRWDVDGQTRIAVDVPGSTQVGLALEDGDVVEPEALELDGRPDAAEAGTHDDDIEMLRTHGTTIYAVPLVPGIRPSSSFDAAQLLPVSGLALFVAFVRVGGTASLAASNSALSSCRSRIRAMPARLTPASTNSLMRCNRARSSAL